MNDLFILIYFVGLSFIAKCSIPCKFCVQGRRRLFRALLSSVTVTVVRGDDIDAMARVTTDQLRMEKTKKKVKRWQNTGSQRVTSDQLRMDETKKGRKVAKDRDIFTMIRLSLMPLL